MPVESPNVLHGNRLRGQLERRQLGRMDEFLETLEQRFVEGLPGIGKQETGKMIVWHRFHRDVLDI